MKKQEQTAQYNRSGAVVSVYSNIKKTCELKLCTGCEICLATCPENAIRSQYSHGMFLPEVDEDKCTQCGLCLKVCPGIDINPFLPNYEKISNDSFDTPCLESYTAYSKNQQIRKNSVSGGMITSLITALIENNEYDKAFVLPFNDLAGKPARLEPVGNSDDIFKAAKSKYLPASAYTVIKELEKKTTERYIIVGTSCLLNGIKKYIQLRNIDEEKLLLLGLFCEKTLNYNLIKYLEKTYRQSNEVLVKLDYRTKENCGWPGKVKLTFNSGRELALSKKVRTRLKRYFQLNRCLFCLDKLNVLSDIAFGDCYIKSHHDRYGKSSVIVRTQKGNDVIQEHSNLFVLEKEQISNIHHSQSLKSKKCNLEYSRSFVKIHNLFGINTERHSLDKKNLEKLLKQQEYIEWGSEINYRKIKWSRRFFVIKSLPKTAVKTFHISLFRTKNLFLRIYSRREKNNSQKNIIIVGGQLFNKGAQAMTFTVVDQLKQRFPDKELYLFSTKDFKRDVAEKEIYNFSFLPWKPSDRMKFLLGINHKNTQNYKQVLADSACIIDISGFKLSSQMGFSGSLGYLVNILIAKKWKVPFYALPQSFGPFNYPLHQKLVLYPLLKMCLSYLSLIFAREKDGIKQLEKFRKSNIESSLDIVLQNNQYNLSHIYSKRIYLKSVSIKPNAVGIVPNRMVSNRMTDDEFCSLYSDLINTLMKSGKNIYVLRHSWEDLGICKKIKNLFKDNKKVELLPDDFNAIELESILKQFDFVVASRYHSIIHSYKNSVPAVVLGWSDKYSELLKEFDQFQYYFDCRSQINTENIIVALDEMMQKYSFERTRIRKKMECLSNMNTFDILQNAIESHST